MLHAILGLILDTPSSDVNRRGEALAIGPHGETDIRTPPEVRTGPRAGSAVDIGKSA
jgi:hypothetical protein